MLLKITLLVVLLVLAAVAGLSVRVILCKNGRFPNTHVSGSKAMRDKGIGCVQSQDFEARRQNPNSINVNKL